MAHESPLPDLPQEPIGRLTAPIVRFMHVEAAGGVVLLLATLSALALFYGPLASPVAPPCANEIGSCQRLRFKSPEKRTGPPDPGDPVPWHSICLSASALRPRRPNQ